MQLRCAGPFGAFFPWLQFYKRGVASPRCTNKTLDHAVLLVGYGTDVRAGPLRSVSASGI